MSVRRVRFSGGGVAVTAELNDSDTADSVWEALPIKGTASTWGDEIYFRTTVTAEEAVDSTDEFELGAVAYWPPGKAICIFFGPTPASVGDEPRMASPGNLIGKVEGDLEPLKKVVSGTSITVARA